VENLAYILSTASIAGQIAPPPEYEDQYRPFLSRVERRQNCWPTRSNAPLTKALSSMSRHGTIAMHGWAQERATNLSQEPLIK